MNKLKQGELFLLLCFWLISVCGIADHFLSGTDIITYAVAAWMLVFGYLIHLLINFLND